MKQASGDACALRRHQFSVMFRRMYTNADMSGRVAYSIRRCAEALDVSPRSVYRLIEAGELRSVTLGRRRLVPAQELERLLTPQEGRA